MCRNVPLIGDDADGLAVVVCESHLNHVITFVVCCVSIIHISADLSIAFSIKSEKKAKKIAVDFAEKNRHVLPLFFYGGGYYIFTKKSNLPT